jgi:hypothetical protein
MEVLPNVRPVFLRPFLRGPSTVVAVCKTHFCPTIEDMEKISILWMIRNHDDVNENKMQIFKKKNERKAHIKQNNKCF